MVTYETCTDTTMDQIFEAFTLGFSDYSVRFNLDQAAFEARFFGPEGNTLENSFIALDQGKPVGLVLGGIRQFDGLKTMRCGTLCMAPDYRGQGVSNKLFELHKSSAVTAECKQLFLEVIANNHRAIKFYEKHGYRSRYTLKYYTMPLPSLPTAAPSFPCTIEETTFTNLDHFRQSLSDCHINWQSDTPFYASSKREALLSAYDTHHRQIALIAMGPHGKVNFLWVDPAFRNQGLGRYLIRQAADKQKVEKVTVCLPNNTFLEGFLIQTGFEKQPLEQYEMYLPL